MGTSWNTEAIKLYAYQLGKRVARQKLFKTLFVGKECLFNGIKLREPPLLDIEPYPKAVIFMKSEDYYLTYSTNKMTVNVSGKVGYFSNIKKCFRFNGDVWEEGSTIAMNATPIWANYDILYASYVAELGGTVFLPASEPIIVQ